MSEVTPEWLEERASWLKHRENLDHEAGMHVGCYSDCLACALNAAAQALRAEREKRERAERERKLFVRAGSRLQEAIDEVCAAWQGGNLNDIGKAILRATKVRQVSATADENMEADPGAVERYHALPPAYYEGAVTSIREDSLMLARALRRFGFNVEDRDDRIWRLHQFDKLLKDYEAALLTVAKLAPSPLGDLPPGWEQANEAVLEEARRYWLRVQREEKRDG